MAGLEITAVVSSIISAFASGMDIFKRMRAKQKVKKRSQKEVPPTREEQQLQESLQRNPRAIRVEYDRSVARHGHSFEVGDMHAHNSLAHTLLKLNTGLVNIINHALSDSARARKLSRKSLYSLSELAAADTIHALTELNRRLGSRSQLALPKQVPQRLEESHGRWKKPGKRACKVPNNPKAPSTQVPEKERPKPDPLARGGWVRSKSGTSVVTVSSGASTPKPAKHKRADSAVSMSKVAHPNLARAGLSSPVPYNCPGKPADDTIPFHTGRPTQQENSQMLDLWLASPEEWAVAKAPPRPPKIPLERSTSYRRPRPPSVATFQTASTKIGEIPEHRWLNQPVVPWENRRLPYTIPPPLEPEPEKKPKGFRAWWKNCNAAGRKTVNKAHDVST